MLGITNILNRENDLQEFFWPIYYFVKEQILVHHNFPLWNNLFLSGMPLLPDPQSPLFYLPNIIFLIFPIDSAFIVSITLHLIWGGVGTYWCAKKGFKFSTATSIFTSILFITSPKMAGFLEAGHLGLIMSYTFLPWILFSILKLTQTLNIRWAILLSIFLAGIYYTHLVTFLLTLPLLIVIFLFLMISSHYKLQVFKLLIFSTMITFGLSAIQLLPQLEWQSYTTRSFLLTDRNVYPKWNSILEFLTNVFIPWVRGLPTIWSIESEKWIPLTLSGSLLALIGFINLTSRLKMGLLLLITLIITLSLNNSSPIYQFLLSQDWYVLLRVSTRIWFVVILIVIFLSGYAFDILIKKGIAKNILIAIFLLCLVETLGLFFTYLHKPVISSNHISEDAIDFLKKDRDKFRVFCINRCISQKEAAKNNLELIEGYNTIQQKNYYKQAWQLTGAYWNYYTLSIPPMGTYTFEKAQPDPISLGSFNTKYVISQYPLTNPNFILEKQQEEYLIYRNNLFLPRAYFWIDNQKSGPAAPILKYSPNHIRVDTSSQSASRLVLSEVYSGGWKAYLNGKEETLVQERPDVLRLVDLKPDTKFVDFKYQPKGLFYGIIITFMTVLMLLSLKIIKRW